MNTAKNTEKMYNKSFDKKSVYKAINTIRKILKKSGVSLSKELEKDR